MILIRRLRLLSILCLFLPFSVSAVQIMSGSILEVAGRVGQLSDKKIEVLRKDNHGLQLILQDEIDPEEALQIFRFAISEFGLILRKEGKRLIVDSSKALTQKEIPSFQRTPRHYDQSFISWNYPLLNLDCNDIAKNLKQVLSKHAQLQCDKKSKALVLTSYWTNLRSFERLIRYLDRGTPIYRGSGRAVNLKLNKPLSFNKDQMSLADLGLRISENSAYHIVLSPKISNDLVDAGKLANKNDRAAYSALLAVLRQQKAYALIQSNIIWIRRREEIIPHLEHFLTHPIQASEIDDQFFTIVMRENDFSEKSKLKDQVSSGAQYSQIQDFYILTDSSENLRKLIP